MAGMIYRSVFAPDGRPPGVSAPQRLLPVSAPPRSLPTCFASPDLRSSVSHFSPLPFNMHQYLSTCVDSRAHMTAYASVEQVQLGDSVTKAHGEFLSPGCYKVSDSSGIYTPWEDSCTNVGSTTANIHPFQVAPTDKGRCYHGSSWDLLLRNSEPSSYSVTSTSRKAFANAYVNAVWGSLHHGDSTPSAGEIDDTPHSDLQSFLQMTKPVPVPLPKTLAVNMTERRVHGHSTSVSSSFNSLSATDALYTSVSDVKNYSLSISSDDADDSKTSSSAPRVTDKVHASAASPDSTTSIERHRHHKRTLRRSGNGRNEEGSSRKIKSERHTALPPNCLRLKSKQKMREKETNNAVTTGVRESEPTNTQPQKAQFSKDRNVISSSRDKDSPKNGNASQAPTHDTSAQEVLTLNGKQTTQSQASAHGTSVLGSSGKDSAADTSVPAEVEARRTSASRSSSDGEERRLFRCPQCRYVTDRKNNLKRHVVTMHQDSHKTQECCGVLFRSKAALRDHVGLFHRGGYRCQICGRNFCRKALLRRHLTVHSGQKDYTCVLCGYATSHKSNLERHHKVHARKPAFPRHLHQRDGLCRSAVSGFKGNHSLAGHEDKGIPAKWDADIKLREVRVPKLVNRTDNDRWKEMSTAEMSSTRDIDEATGWVWNIDAPSDSLYLSCPLPRHYKTQKGERINKRVRPHRVFLKDRLKQTYGVQEGRLARTRLLVEQNAVKGNTANQHSLCTRTNISHACSEYADESSTCLHRTTLADAMCKAAGQTSVSSISAECSYKNTGNNMPSQISEISNNSIAYKCDLPVTAVNGNSPSLRDLGCARRKTTPGCSESTPIIVHFSHTTKKSYARSSDDLKPEENADCENQNEETSVSLNVISTHKRYEENDTHADDAHEAFSRCVSCGYARDMSRSCANLRKGRDDTNREVSSVHACAFSPPDSSNRFMNIQPSRDRKVLAAPAVREDTPLSTRSARGDVTERRERLSAPTAYSTSKHRMCPAPYKCGDCLAFFQRQCDLTSHCCSKLQTLPTLRLSVVTALRKGAFQALGGSGNQSPQSGIAAPYSLVS